VQTTDNSSTPPKLSEPLSENITYHKIIIPLKEYCRD